MKDDSDIPLSNPWESFCKEIGYILPHALEPLRTKTKFTFFKDLEGPMWTLAISISREFHFVANLLHCGDNRSRVASVINSCFGSNVTLKWAFHEEAPLNNTLSDAEKIGLVPSTTDPEPIQEQPIQEQPIQEQIEPLKNPQEYDFTGKDERYLYPWRTWCVESHIERLYQKMNEIIEILNDQK